MFRTLQMVLATVALSAAAYAQSATGIIQGRVTDPSGAAIPAATVTVENQQTGTKQTLTTNGEGNFVDPYLIPGVYRVIAEKAGFQKYQTNDITLQVQKTIDLDVALKVGEVGSTIEVSANAVQLSTENSSVSQVINRKAIVDLPTNNRNLYDFVRLAPGVTGGNGVAASISGGRGGTNEITVDGTTVVVPENNVSTNDTGYQPIIDSVEEFSVITNALSAEYGRTGGGTINVATRGGTNTFHGSLFEFLRNEKLDANSWSNNRNGAKRNPLRRNQFGGSIGGPLTIPKIYSGHNRTFFFFSEQNTLNHSFSSGNATVPTAAWRAGDFSDLKNGSGQAITIYDPATVALVNGVQTRQPFPGNKIPVQRFDPAAVKFLNYYPLPNNTANETNPYTHQNNYFNAGSSINDDYKFDSRVDHNFTEKFRIWVRGSYDHNPASPFNLYNNLGTSGDGPNFGTNYNTALNSVYTLNPTTIISLNYGLARKVYHRDPFSQGIDLTTLGLPAAVQAQAATQNNEFPNISMGGNQSLSGLGQSTFTALRIQSYDHDVRSDITKVLNKHTFKAGFEYRKLFINFRQNGAPSGQFSFNNSLFTQQIANTTSSSTTQGLGFANFLLGLPNASLGGATGSAGSTEHTFAAAESSAYIGGFMQDDWKITRKLTLNIGLRWEGDVPRTERFNRLSYFDIDAPSPLAGKVPDLGARSATLKGAYVFVGTPGAKYGRHQAPMDTNNWGPHIGFAYSINSKTVFRGAYSMGYAGSVLQASGTSGSSGTSGFSGNTQINSSFDGINILATLSNPFPNGFNLPAGPANGANSGASTNIGLGAGGDGSLFNDYQNPAVQQWNANIQRELPASFVVELGYIGSKGNHLLDNETGSAIFNQLPASYLALGSALTTQVANPFYGIITNPTSALSKPTVSYNQLLRPFPQYTDVNAYRKPGGNSIYHAMTISVQKRYSHGLNMSVAFTGGKSIDDTSSQPQGNSNSGSKQDGYNRAADRSLSAFDISRRLVIYANYELPFGKGKHFFGGANRLTDAIIGGWQVNDIYTYQTGTPLSISNGANSPTNIFNPGQRANNNGTSPLANVPSDYTQIPGAQPGIVAFDPRVFSIPAPYTFGNVGRVVSDLRGAKTNAMDFSMFKDWKLKEDVKLRFQAEAYNIGNHPIWSNPGTTINAPATFGIITGKNGNTRNIQLALRLNF